MKPMLAAIVEDAHKLRFPLLASPKLDGVRALVVDGVVMSRSFKPIPNAYVQKLFGKKALNGLDGELIVGKATADDCFRATMSGVMSADGEPRVTFYVFDDTRVPHNPFWRRLATAGQLSRSAEAIMLVDHQIIENVNSLQHYERSMLALGYEGVMLRHPEGLYKFGRSTLKEHWLMKLKRFHDSEALVLDCVEQMRNDNEATTDELGHTKRSSHKENKHGKGVLGAFIAKDLKTGVEFDCGTGFDDLTRANFWARRDALRGQIFKYKHFPTGSKEKPRFPVFLGMRNKLDM